MSATSSLEVVRDGTVLTLALDRPDKKNALTTATILHMSEVLNEYASEDSVRVILLTGRGGVFCTGHDLSSLGTEPEPGTPFEDLYVQLLEYPKPTIAAIGGDAVGGGAGLALCADLRMMVETATLGWPQILRGISSVSGPSILSRLVPGNILKELLFRGRLLSATEAFDLRLVNSIHAASDFDDAVSDLATEISRHPPRTLESMKESISQTRELPLREAIYQAKELLDDVLAGPDAQEGIRSFREKRQPAWMTAKDAR